MRFVYDPEPPVFECTYCGHTCDVGDHCHNRCVGLGSVADRAFTEEERRKRHQRQAGECT